MAVPAMPMINDVAPTRIDLFFKNLSKENSIGIMKHLLKNTYASEAKDQQFEWLIYGKIQGYPENGNLIGIVNAWNMLLDLVPDDKKHDINIELNYDRNDNIYSIIVMDWKGLVTEAGIPAYDDTISEDDIDGFLEAVMNQAYSLEWYGPAGYLYLY